MQYVTYRYLCYDIQQALKQVFADQTLTIEQILFWVKGSVNKIKSKTLVTGIQSGSYKMTFTDLPVSSQTSNINDILKKKKYFELPFGIIDLNYDNGIEWISYDGYNSDEEYCPAGFFQRSTLPQIKMMYDTSFEKPGKDKDAMYFVRINRYVYLFGIENKPIKKINTSIYSTLNPIIGDAGFDDEIILNDEQIADVRNSVIALGRYVMLVPKEREIDGADTRDVPAYKTLSNPNQQQAVDVQNSGQ